MTLLVSTPNWFDSSEVSAPTLNNAASSVLDVFRACLINGFGSKTVTNIAVSGGVATANSTAHDFTSTYGKLLLIEGCSEASLNGRKQPLSVATNTFTYAAPGVADGTYTGTITVKRAPLDWAELYTGTHKAIFQRTAPEANTQLLRVDDADATFARVVMVESASDVDTLVDPAPTAAQISGGAYWCKGQNNTTAKRWAIVGNDRFIYVLMPPNTSAQSTEDAQCLMGFGDGVPYHAGDAHFCILCALTGTTYTTNGPVLANGAVVGGNFAAGTVGSVVSRSRGGVSKSPIFQAQSVFSLRLGVVTAITLPQDVWVIARPVFLVDDQTTKELRGEAPGLGGPLASTPLAGAGAFSIIEEVSTGRVYLGVNCRGGSSSASNAMIDLTGPWYGD